MNLEGKVISFLGDSNTAGRNVADIENNRFDNVILKRCKLKRVNNYGISGTRIAYQRVPSPKARHDGDFCIRAWDLDPESDIIVVMGGSNDYGTGDAPLGNPGDSTRATFCGAVEYLCKLLKDLYPDATVVFLTPPHCKDDGVPSRNPLKENCPESHVLSDYVDMILEIVPKYGFPVFDLYRKLGIDFNNPEQCRKYSFDGLHFNDAGNIVLANAIIEFLEKLDALLH